MRSFLPRGDSPKEPFSTIAGVNDVLYHAGTTADRAPTASAATAITVASIAFAPKLMSPDTRFMQVSLRWKPITMRKAMRRPIKAKPTFSIIICRRRLLCEAPITRRVFMLRMRIGTSESVKFNRFSRAMNRMNTDATVSTFTRLRLPLSPKPTPEKYISSTGVSRKL